MLDFRLCDLLKMALLEDIGCGDVTSEALVGEDVLCEAVILAKQDLVLSGVTIIKSIFPCIGEEVGCKVFFRDGDWVSKGSVIARYVGKARTILKVERVLLNLLQRFCGIATYTRLMVEKLKGTDCRLLDTRKTTPLWRILEKEAVRHGGGSNHRFGLFDGVLIKDNHIAVVGSVRKAVELARSKVHNLLKVEVEVSSMDELEEALEAGADMVLLDNFGIDELKKAVLLCKGRVLCEASGGINLSNVREVARVGVDFISSGAITHSAPAVDLSLKITGS